MKEKIFLNKIGRPEIGRVSKKNIVSGEGKYLGLADYQTYEIRLGIQNSMFGSKSLGVVGRGDLFEGKKKIGSWMTSGKKIYPLNRQKTLKDYTEFLMRYGSQGEGWEIY